MTDAIEKRLKLNDPQVTAAIMGSYDTHLAILEEELGVQLVLRNGEVLIFGRGEQVELACNVLEQLERFYLERRSLTTSDVKYIISSVRNGRQAGLESLAREIILTTPRGKQIRPKTIGQQKYIRAMAENDVVVAIGPAGTGKTYLAVVMAIQALRSRKVSRVILTRPAVEAGEKLGFLPGDFQEKVDPYLRPLYDSLFDVLGMDNTQRYLDRQVIEIAPLAYMRGRTLEDAFVILDEAQNTTPEQMKMFLTRLGFGSQAVATGDITQIDLPKGQVSGLVEAEKVLTGIKGLEFIYFTGADTVRHSLVAKIIEAYENACTV